MSTVQGSADGQSEDLVDASGNPVVRVRAPRSSDVAALVEQCRDPEMLRFTRVPRRYDAAQAEQRIAAVAARWRQPEAERTWAIGIGAAADFAGLIDLRPEAGGTAASLGFSLHPAARGRGVMSRAVRLLAEHAFTSRPWGEPVARLHWSAVVGNWSSRRVAWACGFTHHGTLPGSHVDPEHPGAAPLDQWQASLGADEPRTPRTPWFVPPVLDGPAGSGPSIRLRPWREDDVAAVESPIGDPAHWMPPAAVLRRESFTPWLLSRRERMAAGVAIEWCVSEAATDRALATVALFTRMGTLTSDSAELGYQVLPAARGRGVATAAARRVVEHARASVARGGLGLRRLVAQTSPHNQASNAVLTASGFAAVGREHRVDVRADGSYADGLYWELV